MRPLWLLLIALSLSAQEHHFKITQHFAIARDAVRLWIPLPMRTAYQHFGDLKVSGNFASQQLQEGEAPTLYLAFEGSEANATISFTVATTDRYGPTQSDENVSRFLLPSTHIRTDGIVAQKAHSITQGAQSPAEKASRIFEWIVQNMFRDPKVRGCGLGDAAATLESGYLGGKCADVSAVFVALLRASGIPAREVFGIRAAPSRYAKAYGAEGDITAAQHCRGEYYLEDQGWIPADPGDVTKLILVENLERNASRVREEAARQSKSWEMN
ncbi:MAG: transglutaminase domain-containing protein [Campylobacterales bacterium]|nr:transglutaminase domain-containing protein [Campylobacterales bacterium]